MPDSLQKPGRPGTATVKISLRLGLGLEVVDLVYSRDFVATFIKVRSIAPLKLETLIIVTDTEALHNLKSISAFHNYL